MQESIDLLTQRTSSKFLTEPAPSAEQLEIMLQAAGRAPDHMRLKPWRFLTISEEQRHNLGHLFVQSALAEEPELPIEKKEKLLNAPLRAPMILVAIASPVEEPKVPEIEQVITAGCAAHAVLYAAYAQGLGAIWRTGPMAFNTKVKEGLGLSAEESIVGFIYLGQPEKIVPVPTFMSDRYLQHWLAK